MQAGLGERLRIARQRLGLTQSELAARAGLSAGAVRDLEQGRSSHPRARSVHALADVLGLDRDQLQRLAVRPRPEPASVAGPVHISVLGPLTVSRAGKPVPIGPGRHRLLLARLALRPEAPVSRDELVDLLWGDDPPPSAHNVLQTHVSRLRRILGDASGMLTLHPGGYRLQAAADQLDLIAYRERLAASRAAAAEPRREFDLLSAALEHWQGDLPAADLPELEADPLVIALADEQVDATIRLARLGRILRRQPEVLPRLRRLAARHPWHESLHAALIGALAACGQQAAALTAFDEVRRRLIDELGVDPGAELVEARQSVLAMPTTNPDRVRPWTAPSPPPDFVGRAEHLVRLERALRPGGVGVVSGMAGVGKTSLALRVAQALRSDFPDGQLYVDLRGADETPVDLLALLAHLLRALGVEGRRIPGNAAAAAALYRDQLAGRRMLVLIDNARNAAQVRPLLPGSATCAVLVTSRNDCAGLPGATLVELPVLTVGEALAMLGQPSDREAAVAVIDACGRLPVALRVLAGRPGLTVTDLRERLDELRSGDVLVTAGFELSYRELAPRLARVFRSAALIPGTDFSAEAAAALVGADAATTRRDLDQLAGEHLVQALPPGRYRYHDLLRLYALRCAADDAVTLEGLLDWYLTRTASAMRLLYAEMVRLPLDLPPDPEPHEDIDAAAAWLEAERDSLVAATLAASADPANQARAWHLADQLRGYFFIHRDVVPWLTTGRAGLAAADQAGDLPAQAAMHQTVGMAHWSLGEHETALASYRRGLQAAEHGGWAVGAAYLLHNLGLVHGELGQVEAADELYRRALRVGAGREFDHIRAVTLNDLGVLCSERGRLADAAEYLQAALAVNQGAARRPSAIVNRSNLGMVLRQLERFDEAREHLEVSIAHYRSIRSQHSVMANLDELSRLSAQLGEWSSAVGAAGEALRIARELADRRSEAGVLNTLGSALLGSRAVTDARAAYEDALAISRERGYRFFEAQAGAGLAAVLMAEGDVGAAVTTAEQARGLAEGNDHRAIAADARIVLARAALLIGDHPAATGHCRAARAMAGAPGSLREITRIERAVEEYDRAGRSVLV